MWRRIEHFSMLRSLSRTTAFSLVRKVRSADNSSDFSVRRASGTRASAKANSSASFR